MRSSSSRCTLLQWGKFITYVGRKLVNAVSAVCACPKTYLSASLIFTKYWCLLFCGKNRFQLTVCLGGHRQVFIHDGPCSVTHYCSLSTAFRWETWSQTLSGQCQSNSKDKRSDVKVKVNVQVRHKAEQGAGVKSTFCLSWAEPDLHLCVHSTQMGLWVVESTLDSVSRSGKKKI